MATTLQYDKVWMAADGVFSPEQGLCRFIRSHAPAACNSLILCTPNCFCQMLSSNGMPSGCAGVHFVSQEHSSVNQSRRRLCSFVIFFLWASCPITSSQHGGRGKGHTCRCTLTRPRQKNAFDACTSGPSGPQQAARASGCCDGGC